MESGAKVARYDTRDKWEKRFIAWFETMRQRAQKEWRLRIEPLTEEEIARWGRK